jgi:hypothetical protein
MSAPSCCPPAPVGRQGPPARAAAHDSCRSLRSAPGPLDYGDGLPYPISTADPQTLTHHPRCAFALLGMQPE